MRSALLAIDRVDAITAAAARAACRDLGLELAEWRAGDALGAGAAALIAGLAAGERRVPAELRAAVAGSSGLRLILCTGEPTVQPRVELAAGRLVLLGPPIGPDALLGALAAAAAGPDVAAAAPRDGARFEALRAAYWVAWVRGAHAPAVTLDEAAGATLVIGPRAAAVASALRGAPPAQLSERAGRDHAVLRLSAGADEWAAHWPRRDAALWLCSPARFPARWRWPAEPGLVGVPAFPGDQMIARWRGGAQAPEGGADPSASRPLVGSGPDVHAAHAALAAADPHLAGVIVEVR